MAKRNGLLPSSAEAELGLLCAAFLAPSPTLSAAIEAGITGAHFYHPGHAPIWDILFEFWQDNEPVDIRLAMHCLRERGQLDRCFGEINGNASSGAAFLAEIATYTPTAALAGKDIAILKTKLIQRSLVTAGNAMAANAAGNCEDAGPLIEAAEAELLKIVRMREGQKIHSRTMKELAQRATDRLQAAMEGTGEIDMPTGIKELDNCLLGFRAPETTLLLGKPSDGKSCAALNWVEELAVKRGKRCGIISMEMSDDQCADRLLASCAWVNLREIKQKRHMTDHQMDKWAAAAKRIAEAPIFIRDDGQLSMAEIGATFATWKARHGLDFGIIDHAQLIRGDGKSEKRVDEMEKITRDFKPMAKRLGIPLLILSQVTEVGTGHQVSYRTKNSTAMQEDADTILSISHDGKDSFITVHKQRDGERNVSVPVQWIPALQRFRSKDHEAEQQPELPAQKKPGK